MNTSTLIKLSVVFILFTVIGTISHEYGHIVVAKLLGYETELHYGSMRYTNPDLPQEEIPLSHDLLIIAGGPLQTILTGLTGLVILFFRRNKRNTNTLYWLDWLAVFMSLFWLRAVFNIVVHLAKEIMYPDGSYFGGDEAFISNSLGWWEGSLALPLAISGVLVLYYIIFKVVPYQLRYSFMAGGLFGGVAGFVMWMHLLGPVLLP